jgi:hypothetical protein
MCFSATASFIAGVSLTGMGIATVKMTQGKAEMPFAMIPLLFGVQQLIEGMLWLSFEYEAHLLNVVMTYLFVFFLTCHVADIHAIFNWSGRDGRLA